MFNGVVLKYQFTKKSNY